MGCSNSTIRTLLLNTPMEYTEHIYAISFIVVHTNKKCKEAVIDTNICKMFGPEKDLVLGVWCEYFENMMLLPLEWNRHPQIGLSPGERWQPTQHQVKHD